MNRSRNPLPWLSLCGLALLVGYPAAHARGLHAKAEPAAAPVRKIPHAEGPVSVAIYEFRSNLPELPARATTDMFVTALTQNGAFKVVERSQLGTSVMQEKQLNSQGLTSGKSSQKQLRDAQYIFEGAISELNESQDQGSSAVGIAGMQLSGGRNHDVLAIDVRIIDAESGDVLDAVTTRREIRSKAAGVAGVGSFLGGMLARHGHDTTYVPDVNVQQQHKDSIDEALRALITDSVAQVAAHF
jgi:curli biogenesis system outer membrane secretion channel CsgG